MTAVAAASELGGRLRRERLVTAWWERVNHLVVVSSRARGGAERILAEHWTAGLPISVSEILF